MTATTSLDVTNDQILATEDMIRDLILVVKGRLSSDLVSLEAIYGAMSWLAKSVKVPGLDLGPLTCATLMDSIVAAWLYRCCRGAVQTFLVLPLLLCMNNKQLCGDR